MKPTRTIEQIKEALALPDTSALSFSAEEVRTALAQQFYFGMDTALAAPAAPLPAQPEQVQPQQSGSIRPSAEPAGQHDVSTSAYGPVRLVGDLVRNLLTLDQTMPIFSAFHVDCKGERRCRTLPVSVSYERVIEGKWVDSSRKDAPYSAVVWAKPQADEQPQVPAGTAGCSQESPDAGAAPLPELTGQSEALNALLTRIDDAAENYERFGGICQFEGDPMIYASTLEEIVTLRGEFHVATLAASPSPVPAQQQEPKCAMCNDHGSVGRAPDDYYPCPGCSAETAALGASMEDKQ